MTNDTILAAAIFVVAYALIAVERWDRTLIALLGGLVMVGLGVLDQQEAFAAIDLNVIFLLVGMMVIASILSKTGFFEWIAIRSVVVSDGHPIRMLLILATITAVFSAFLDNVTTVVLMTPITLSVARRLDISPVPYLITQILASNIGGTATLIGDPPNILIGSAAGLGFGDFLLNLAPVVVLIFVAFVVIVRVAFRHTLKVPDERREAALEGTESRAITDRGLLAKALVVTGLTIVGFLLHGVLGVEVATVALLGATALMLVAGFDPHRILRDVEWSTIFFFVGLFILVEGIVQVGIVSGIAEWIAEAANGNLAAASLSILWFSAIASAIVDNIPYTATAIPVVEQLVAGGMEAEPLWWSLALGACLGGNLTIIGASANVVVSNLSERAGHPIRFLEFLKYGAVVTLMSMVISTAYVWVRYLS
ncbi:MAG TPA: ArsB/NhaD family transporter [Candidatus Limnocylindrales bacterium]|nr:ArsB/NhaD family transporter [Candidatus Limnocylindrales bacterium]